MQKYTIINNKWKSLNNKNKKRSWCNDTAKGNGHRDPSSNPPKAVYISQSGNTLGKGMNPTIPRLGVNSLGYSLEVMDHRHG